jgi:hypothetical protein
VVVVHRVFAESFVAQVSIAGAGVRAVVTAYVNLLIELINTLITLTEGLK